MPRPEIPTNADNVHNALVDIGRMYVRNQAVRIEDRFPTLKDGSSGLKIGLSLTALWHQVLRPDGSIEWVDYHKETPEGPVDTSFYLDRRTLNKVEHHVDSVDFGWGEAYGHAKEIVDGNTAWKEANQLSPAKMVGKPFHKRGDYARETVPLRVEEDGDSTMEVVLTMGEYSNRFSQPPNSENTSRNVIHLVVVGEKPEDSRILYEMEGASVKNADGELVKDREELAKLRETLAIIEVSYARERQVTA